MRFSDFLASECDWTVQIDELLTIRMRYKLPAEEKSVWLSILSDIRTDKHLDIFYDQRFNQIFTFWLHPL